MFIGLALILIGIVFIVISAVSMALSEKSNEKVDVAVGGFIGPIPFGFFTKKKMFWLWLCILILCLVLWFLAKNLK